MDLYYNSGFVWYCFMTIRDSSLAAFRNPFGFIIHRSYYWRYLTWDAASLNETQNKIILLLDLQFFSERRVATHRCINYLVGLIASVRKGRAFYFGNDDELGEWSGASECQGRKRADFIIRLWIAFVCVGWSWRHPKVLAMGREMCGDGKCVHIRLCLL